MKKYLIALLGGTLLFASCKSPDSALTPAMTTIALSSVPSLVLASMSRNFPTAADITWRQTAPTAYMATFKQSQVARTATFQKTGTLMKAGEVIDPGALPRTITDYLTTNYPGYAIVQADVEKDAAGVVKGYETLITVKIVQYEVEFDAAGAFSKLETPDGHEQGNAIAASALPAAITAYLNANYAGYVIREAETHSSNGTLAGYEVEIVQNNTEFDLTFDAAGTFVDLNAKDGDDDHENEGEGDHNGGQGDHNGKASTIVQSALPAAVGTYLAKNYAGYTFVSAKVEKNAAGIVQGYEVHFTLGGKKYEAEFDAAGVFLKME